MSQNWFAKLLHRVLGRRSAVRPAPLGLKKLEDRRLLNATFALDNGVLTLFDFVDTGSNEDTTQVTISQGQADFGSGAADAFFFTLDEGDWNEFLGMHDGFGAGEHALFAPSGMGGKDRVLAVAVDAFTELSINDTVTMANPVKVNVVFGGDAFSLGGMNPPATDGDPLDLTGSVMMVSLVNVGDVTQGGETDITNLGILNADSVNLAHVSDLDIDNFAASVLENVIVDDVDDIDIEALTVTHSTVVEAMSMDPDDATLSFTDTVVNGITSNSDNMADDGGIQIEAGGDIDINADVDGVDTVMGSTNDNAIFSADGAVHVNDPVSAQIVRIVADGDIDQAVDGIITADQLGVRQESNMNVFDILLGEANDVDLFAGSNASEDGQIVLQSTAGVLTIDSVAADGAALFTATDGVSTTNGANDLNDILLVANDSNALTMEALVINEAVTAPDATVRLVAHGNINQQMNGTITAGSLGVRQQLDDGMTVFNVTLGLNNAVDVFAAVNVSPDGQIVFHSVNDLTVGTVAADGSGAFVATSGVVTTNGMTNANDIILVADNANPGNNEDLIITQAVNAGDGTVRLIAFGNMQQSGAGIITAANLGVRQIRTGANSSITLGLANNVDVFAGANLSLDGQISFASTQDLTIGSVANDGAMIFATTTGVTTNSGDVLIIADNSTGGDTETLTINQAIDTTDAIVRLAAQGDITQSMTGIITAAGLGVRQLLNDATARNISLGQNNQVALFAANNASADGQVVFKTDRNLTIGAVTANGAFAATSGVATTAGTNNTNEILIQTSDGMGGTTESLTINGAVSAAGSTVRLSADGNIAQNLSGIITSDRLGVIQTNTGNNLGIDLCEANVVNVFAAENRSNSTTFPAGGYVSFRSTQDLTIGTVAAATSELATFDNFNVDGMGISGVVTDAVDMTNRGKIELQSDGDLILDAAQQMGLQSTGGSLSFIAGNSFELLTDFVMPGRELFVSVGTGFDVDVVLEAETIRIIANGAITQSEVITATSLGVRQESVTADTDIALWMENQVANFAAANLSAGGDVMFNNFQSLTITTVSSGTQKLTEFANTVGITTNNGEVLVQAADSDPMFSIEDLTIAQQINAGTGDVRLIAHGNILQGGAGIITANELGVRLLANPVDPDTQEPIPLDITLGQNNAVDEFSALNVSEGGLITFRSIRDLTIGTSDAVMKNATTIFDQTVGVVSTNGIDQLTLLNRNDISIQSTGVEAGNSLIIDDDVNAGGAIVRLIGAGNITQNVGDTITASQFGVRQTSGAVGANVQLLEANDVDVFAANNVSSTGQVQFRNAGSLMIGTVANRTVQLVSFTTSNGVVTNNGDILLQTDDGANSTVENLTINEVVNAGTADVRLIAHGTITQNDDALTNGLITANELGVRQLANMNSIIGLDLPFDIELGLNNAVDEFAAFNASEGGMITFRSTRDVTIGTVETQATFAQTVGVTSTDGDLIGTGSLTRNDITIQATGVGAGSNSLILDDVVNSGDAIVRLIGSGNIVQNADAIITAARLGVRQISNGNNLNIELCEANQVAVFAAENFSNSTTTVGGLDQGFVAFRSALDLSVGTVSAKSAQLIVFDNVNTDGTGLSGVVTDANEMTAGGDILLQSDQELTIVDQIVAHGGNLSLIAGMFDLVTTINMGTSDLYINVGTGFVIDNALTAATIRIVADGAISQTGSGVITAGALGLRQEALGANLDITLTELSNNVQNFSAFNASTGGMISFVSQNDLTVGTVTTVTAKNAEFVQTTGVVSTDGDITLVAQGRDGGNNSLTLSQQVNAGTGDVRLAGFGHIGQGAAGLITANELSVFQVLNNPLVPYNIDLCETNHVDEFAALNVADGGFVSFLSDRNLLVGQVTGKSLPIFGQFPTITGVQTVDGDVEIESTVNVTVNNAITIVDSVNDANTTRDGSILLDAGGALDLNVNLSTDADIFLDTESSLTLDRTLSASVVRIQADGAILQTAAGGITAVNLGVRQQSTASDIDIELCDANNVMNFSASNLSEGGDILFHSDSNLIVGSVGGSTLKNASFSAINGVSTIDGDMIVDSSGDLTVDNSLTVADGVDGGVERNGDIALIAGMVLDLNVGLITNQDILLSSNASYNVDQVLTADRLLIQASGDITQTALIDVETLAVRQRNTALGVDILLGANNSVSTLTAFNASDGGEIAFRSTQDLTIGAVDAVTFKNTTFAQTVGVQSRLDSARVTESDGTFVDGVMVVDVVDPTIGDILIDTAGSLTIEQVIRAGGDALFDPISVGTNFSAAADIRLVAGGTISQVADITRNGILLANELGVRIEGAAGGTDLLLDTLANRVDAFAAFNSSADGDIHYQDADGLLINFVSAHTVQNAMFGRTDGVVASGGDIFIESHGLLRVVGYADMFANPRDIVSTDGVIDNTAMSGESITLLSNDGNIRLGQNVVVSTDDDPTSGVSALETGDQLSIQAGTGTFIVEQGVELRTDGGVANTFAPRPVEANQAGMGLAFFSQIVTLANNDVANILMTGDQGEWILTAFSAVIGNPGEENLRISLNWNDPISDSTFPGTLVSDLETALGVMFDNTVSSGTNPEQEQVLLGGVTREFGHLYSFEIDQNFVLEILNQNEFTVNFGVQHHQSIQVNGAQVTQNGVTEDVDGMIEDMTPDANQGNITRSGPSSLETGLDFFPLQIRNGTIIPFREPDPPPTPFAPQFIFERPEDAHVVPTLAVVTPTPSRATVSPQSYDFFELRREGVEQPIVEYISEEKGDSLLDPKQLREFIRDEGIGDETGYELWLITSKMKEGQPIRIERIILKFDIIDERPIPAVDSLENIYPELQLVPIDDDGNPIELVPDPMSDGATNNGDDQGAEPEAALPENGVGVPQGEPGTPMALLGPESRIRLDEAHAGTRDQQVLAGSILSAVAISSLTRPVASSTAGFREPKSLLNRFFDRRKR